MSNCLALMNKSGERVERLCDIGLKVMWTKQSGAHFSHHRRVKRLSLVEQISGRPNKSSDRVRTTKRYQPYDVGNVSPSPQAELT